MSNDAEPSQPRGISLELAHEMRRDKAIVDLQEQVRKLTKELEWVKGSEWWVPRPKGLDVTPIDIAYSSSHDDHEDRGNLGRGHPRDDLGDLKIEAPEFDYNLKSENYIDWVQAIERIIKLKEYNDEKAFKLVILKLKGYASLCYETLKKNRARETKSKVKTWSKLKKYMEKRFFPPSYKQELYLKITTLSQEKLQVEEYIWEFEQLHMSVGLNEDNELTIARFIKGLFPSIAHKLELQPCLSFNDICHLEIKIEK